MTAVVTILLTLFVALVPATTRNALAYAVREGGSARFRQVAVIAPNNDPCPLWVKSRH